MKEPLISIIIPTYNRANLISDTLDSVLGQTYQNWECLVINDDSTDNTESIIKKYVDRDCRFQYFKRPKNRHKGANACRNYGFELSKGKYVNWLDDDDLIHKDKLLLQVDALESGDFNFSVCQTLVFENSVDNVIGFKSEHIYSDNIFEDYLKQKIVWLTQAPLFKANFFNDFEYLFDEELQAAQEWEFYCRILNKCSNYNAISEGLVYLRQHKRSMSSSSNHRMKLWNYFFARYKVYSNETISITADIASYLEDFMVFYFKQMIRKGFTKEAFLVFKLFILKSDKFSLKDKFLSFMAVLSFAILKRGDIFLKKVSF